MANITIRFNNTDYFIEESVLASATASFEAYLDEIKIKPSFILKGKWEIGSYTVSTEYRNIEASFVVNNNYDYSYSYLSLGSYYNFDISMSEPVGQALFAHNSSYAAGVNEITRLNAGSTIWFKEDAEVSEDFYNFFTSHATQIDENNYTEPVYTLQGTWAWKNDATCITSEWVASLFAPCENVTVIAPHTIYRYFEGELSRLASNPALTVRYPYIYSTDEQGNGGIEGWRYIVFNETVTVPKAFYEGFTAALMQSSLA